MSLEKLRTISKRCALLACSPPSLSSALAHFQRYGTLKRVFYWPRNNNNRGVLLVEAADRSELRSALYPLMKRNMLESLVKNGSQQPCPAVFRVCSDPSIWSTCATNVSLADRNSLVKFMDNGGLRILRSNISPPKLDKQMFECNSIAEQFKIIPKTMRLSFPDLLARQVLSDSIEELLRYFRPNARTSIFGSVANGLGLLTSDVDIFITLESEKSPHLAASNPLDDGEAKSDLASLLTRRSLQDKPYTNFLPLLRKALIELDPLGFSCSKLQLHYIPLLRMSKFGLIGVGVDISHASKKKLAHRKQEDPGSLMMTSLISLLTTWLPSLTECVLSLKFIGHKTKMINLRGPSTLTSFKLTMLFFHYLQISGHLPSVDQLESMKIDPSAPFSCDNTPRPTQLSPLPPTDILLVQFFNHLLKMKPHFVMNLRTGRAEPFESVGRFLLSDFLISPNPFSPSENMLSGISERVWLKLLPIFRHVLSVLTSENVPSNDRNWGLLSLSRQQIDGIVALPHLDTG